MGDFKPCYGKCELCVWKYNGGCSEWNWWKKNEDKKHQKIAEWCGYCDDFHCFRVNN